MRTRADEERYRRAYEATETDAQAAALLGTTRAAFRGWRRSRDLPVRLKKPKFVTTPEELEVARHMLSEGASFEAIAAHINEHSIGERKWIKTPGSVAWNAFKLGIISKEELDRWYEGARLRRIAARAAGRDTFRSSVLERDGGKCVICGSRKQLEVDHIVEFWRGGANEATNGLTLCKECHGLKTRPRNSASWHTFAERYSTAIARLGFRAEFGMCSLHGHHYLMTHAIADDGKSSIMLRHQFASHPAVPKLSNPG